MKKLVIALMSIVLSVCTAWAQERPQADVQVRFVRVLRAAPVAAGAVTAGAAIAGGAATVPPPRSAPVRVTKGGGEPSLVQLVCDVEVYNYHDDNAGQAQLRILLPVGVDAVRMSPGCTASITIPLDGSQGFVMCSLGDIAVGESKYIRVFTTLPPSGVHYTFGAFAWSNVPDPDPHNNYRVGTAP